MRIVFRGLVAAIAGVAGLLIADSLMRLFALAWLATLIATGGFAIATWIIVRDLRAAIRVDIRRQRQRDALLRLTE
jgi:hypothetical protein